MICLTHNPIYKKSQTLNAQYYKFCLLYMKICLNEGNEFWIYLQAINRMQINAFYLFLRFFM